LIALTGWGQEGDRQRTLEHGFDHHLVKPLDLQELNAIIGTPESMAPAISSRGAIV
jgi:DNA-binding response OmpR family regulator